MRRYAIVVLLFYTMCMTAGAQSYSLLVFDKNQSAYMGAQNFMTLQHLIYKATDNYIRDTLFTENTFIRKSGGIGYRLAKLVLFDHPVNRFISLTQHEVFGHGQRFEELGYTSISYSTNLSFPYGNGHGFTRGSMFGNFATSQESMVLNISGVEANNLLADQITCQVLLDDQLHYSQAILYHIAQNNLFSYLWKTRNQNPGEISSSNDMNNYVRGINYYFNQSSDSGYTVKQLSNQAFITFANPMQLYSVYTVLYNYAFRARKKMDHIPMIKIGPIRYLPAFTYSLTPFGSQYTLVNHIKHKQQLYTGAIGIGDPTFTRFYNLSFKAFNIVNSRKISLNVHIDFWNQTELELETRGKPPGTNKTGESIKADVLYRPFGSADRVGGFLQLGYKTKGYTVGEPLDEGYIIRFGLSVHL